MYGLTLIFVLVVMGGAIAYIGDKLGSKVGKKKLTVFGLRPKHTSILVTIITGFLIASTTLGILTLVSSDVRTALFGMEALKTELTSLSQEVFKQNDELTVNRAALETKTQEYLELTKKITQTTRELATVEAERDRAADTLATIQTEYAAAKHDLVEAQQEIDRLVETKEQLDQRVAELNSAKTKLEDDVQRLNDLTANLRRGMQIVREGSILFRAGEALGTSAVKGGGTREATAQTLGELILRTNFIVLEKMGMSDQRVEALWISQADFDELVNLLDRSNDEYVVRILSANNTIYGEPVIGQFEIFPNKLLYNKDKVVYTETITVPDTQKAEETMLMFLQKVNAEAIRQGVLPDPLQGTVGAISGSQLFEAVKRLQSVRGPVTLSAVTTDNIYSVGPLKINIVVSPLLSSIQ